MNAEKDNDDLPSSHEIEIIKQDDERFPESLKNLPKGRSPEKLYVHGKDFDFNKCVAIIGTRKPSQEGLELSFEIAIINLFTILSAPLITSMWPYVIGSNVPGYIPILLIKLIKKNFHQF